MIKKIQLKFSLCVCMHVCVRGRARACVRACARVRVCVCLHEAECTWHNTLAEVAC